MSRRVRQLLPAVIGLVLFLAALGVLRTELRTLSWHGLVADVLATPPWRLGLALLLTVVNYALLTGYEFLGLAMVVLAVDEARQRRGQIARLGVTFAPVGRLVEQLTPRALSILTFLGACSCWCPARRRRRPAG